MQLPEILYLITERADGRRDFEQIGAEVSAASGRGLGADEVRFLAEQKLRPLGVLAGPDGSTPELPKLDPLLGLKLRAGVVPERLTWALTSVFRLLFLPPVVVAVVAGLVALDAWLLLSHGVAPAARQLLYQPALLLMLLGAVVLATAFHEIGHATACRYGGARPGKMGIGLYLIWPVFYTDVTDAYRLGRWGRLRTDLGGVYFNSIFALATAGAYFATSFEPLLLIVLIQNFAMLQQLLPFVRLDGYYVISDLTGVPDMFSRIRPVLSSLLPGRGLDERVAELKPWARRVVVAYVAVLVPLLLGVVVVMVLQAPRLFATAYDSLAVQYDRLAAAPGALSGAGAIVQMCALVLPALGMTVTGGRIGSRLAGGAWSWSRGEPLRRAGVCAGAAVALACALWTWWPNGEYKSIQPGERGTLRAAVSSLAALPSGRPALTRERELELGGAPSERERRRGEPPPAAPSSAAPSDRQPESESGAERERNPGEQEPGAALPADPEPGEAEPQTTTTTPADPELEQPPAEELEEGSAVPESGAELEPEPTP